MPRIYIDKETALELHGSRNGEVVCEEYIVEDAGEWIDDGKYDNKEIVFKYENKFYSLWISRTGSYYTEYYLSIEDEDTFKCWEVESVEVTKKEWKAV